jgi:hypothetical protein
MRKFRNRINSLPTLRAGCGPEPYFAQLAAAAPILDDLKLALDTGKISQSEYDTLFAELRTQTEPKI